MQEEKIDLPISVEIPRGVTKQTADALSQTYRGALLGYLKFTAHAQGWIKSVSVRRGEREAHQEFLSGLIEVQLEFGPLTYETQVRIRDYSEGVEARIANDFYRQVREELEKVANSFAKAKEEILEALG